jgi:lysosomal Pro-X carboxypeptidase
LDLIITSLCKQTREQFGYLTAEQALADFAENIVWLKREYGATDTPVILFGGSYGGMLAAWFRMKYPHLALGALAASAPVRQFPGIYDCHGYFSIVTKDFSDYSQTCSDTIRASWPLIRERASSEDGRRWLSQKFNLCPGEELSSDASVDRFVAWISAAYEYMAMTDYPNPAVFLQPMPAYPIRVCLEKKETSSSEKTD